jgi:protein CpxP
MRTNKVLVIALVLLLLVNVAMLVFFLKGRKHREPGKRSDAIEMMKKDVGMTDQQVANFKKLKADHFKNVGPVFDSIKTLKKSMFELVKADAVNDSVVSNYSGLIAEQQSIVDKATINHFRTVRALFTGDQQKKYDDFIQKMMQRRMKGGPGGKGRDSADKKMD